MYRMQYYRCYTWSDKTGADFETSTRQKTLNKSRLFNVDKEYEKNPSRTFKEIKDVGRRKVDTEVDSY